MSFPKGVGRMAFAWGIVIASVSIGQPDNFIAMLISGLLIGFGSASGWSD